MRNTMNVYPIRLPDEIIGKLESIADDKETFPTTLARVFIVDAIAEIEQTADTVNDGGLQ